MMIREAYAKKITRTLYCYDLINVKCSVGMFGYADGMRTFIHIIKQRCFDFHKVFEAVTKAIIGNAKKITYSHNIEIEFIRNTKAFRKNDKIADILEEHKRKIAPTYQK